MSNIESLLKKYEPFNYELINSPLVKDDVIKKDYVGCSGEYSNVKFGIDENYWYNVIKADESVNE